MFFSLSVIVFLYESFKDASKEIQTTVMMRTPCP